MKIRIPSLFLANFLFISMLASSQSLNKAYLSYIDQYSQLAQKQQKEHRIPSSIILAQGLLESGAGQSTFSKSSNNHFGIKCSDWTGDKFYWDDDAKGECFRKYEKVLDSYEDHAKFLINRTRYAFLFDLKPTDYEGWAFGLKKAGYATDPTYAFKLISIIENYDLHKLDLGENYSVVNSENVNTPNPKNNASGSMGSIAPYVNHVVMKVNGVKFVSALPGDSYRTLADEFEMSENRLRKYNDDNSTFELNTGKRIFISAKKNKAPKDCANHRVTEGESMLSISQDYGIKVVELYALNNMTFEKGAEYGKVLLLR
ncbi:MAG: glucosaminidase domain-containing protein [Paludibacter sp.]